MQKVLSPAMGYCAVRKQFKVHRTKEPFRYQIGILLETLTGFTTGHCWLTFWSCMSYCSQNIDGAKPESWVWKCPVRFQGSASGTSGIFFHAVRKNQLQIRRSDTVEIDITVHVESHVFSYTVALLVCNFFTAVSSPVRLSVCQ